MLYRYIALKINKNLKKRTGYFMMKRLRAKVYGFFLIFCVLLGVFSTTAFAAEKVKLTSVTSPEYSKISIEWDKFSGAKYYEIRLARASRINAGEAGEQKIVDASTRGVTYKTKYNDIEYKVRVRALDKNKKKISDWSDWTSVYIKGKGGTVSSNSNPSNAPCSDATFAALQKAYDTALMIHNQSAAVYELPQVPANPEIENCINTSADAINAAGNLVQGEMTEAEAKELTKSLEELSSVLLVFYKQMAAYVN